MEPMTKEQFQAALPEKMKKSVNQELIDGINNALSSQETLEIFKENLLTYGNVLKEGKFKMDSYISAVKYVSFKLLGATNKDAYTRTFPDKYARFLAEGVTEKDIASYSTAYNKSKLVNLIYEQTLIPTHVLNAPYYQQAINVQVDLMYNAKSEKVRSDAATCLIVNLKKPESQKVELDVGFNHGSIIDDYERAMSIMVEKQKELIAAGGDIKQIANASIRKCDPVIIDVPKQKEPELVNVTRPKLFE